VCFSPDGKRLAGASSYKTVKVWDSATGQELLTLNGNTYGVGRLCYSPDGRRLAGVGNDGKTLRVWDGATGQELLNIKGYTGIVNCLCFSFDGLRLASATHDKKVNVWDVTTGQELLTLKGHTDFVNSVCFSPDGRRLASASSDKTVKVWDGVTGQELLTLKGNTYGVQSVCFSPDGRCLAGACFDRTVSVWEGATGQVVLTIRGHTEVVSSVCFSPDGKRLASASGDGTIKVWDGATGQELLTTKGHTTGVHWVSFSPDGRRLASASSDKTVKVWDGVTGEEILALKGHNGGVKSVCFSPDGKRLASASLDKTAKVWDGATGKELFTLKGHSDTVWSVCFSPDGKRLASASFNGTVKVWDGATGQELLTLEGPIGVATSVGFSLDGKRVVSQDTTEVVRSWDAVSGQVIIPCVDPAPARGPIALSPDGTRRAFADGDLVCIIELKDPRPPSDLVFLKLLNDPIRRLLWHRAEAFAAEAQGKWFAAAHHLAHLLRLADAADNPSGLRVRRLRAVTLLHASDAESFLAAAPTQLTNPADAIEKALADLYDYLDRPSHALPWGLEPDAHAALLRRLRATEERLLRLFVWHTDALKAGRILAPDLSKLKPSFRDDFDKPKWFVTKDGGFGYENGKYHIRIPQGNGWWFAGVPIGGLSDFACEVVGRVHGPRSKGWGVAVVNDSPVKERGILVRLDSEARLHITPHIIDPEQSRGPWVGPIAHPAIKRGEQFNALLFVVRGRVLEVYVNGIAVCDPVIVDRDFTPARLALVAVAEDKGVQVEFTRITIWPTIRAFTSATYRRGPSAASFR
jgi:WD40 repeat protein